MRREERANAIKKRERVSEKRNLILVALFQTNTRRAA